MKKSQLLKLIENVIVQEADNAHVDKIYKALVGIDPSYPHLAKAIARFMSAGTAEDPGFTKEQAADFMRILHAEMNFTDEN